MVPCSGAVLERTRAAVADFGDDRKREEDGDNVAEDDTGIEMVDGAVCRCLS